MNKKEKKKFKRKNIRLKNRNLYNIQNYEDAEIIEDKRSVQKKVEQSGKSNKSNLNLKQARVVEVLSNNKCIVNYLGKNIEAIISGRLKQIGHHTRTIIAVGDKININLDTNRIEEILPRENTLSRFTEDSFQREIIIATNIDQVVITSSFAYPDYTIGLIDRYLCAAAINNITPVICVNKFDLAVPIQLEDFDYYKKIGIKVLFTSIKDGTGIKELKEILKDKDTVFSGNSGVGKSSIINYLQPGLNLRVAEVSDYNKKGIHTTTSTKIIFWNFGGSLIDTPGIKTFTLHNKHKEFIPGIFPGFNELRKYCKFNNCTHTHEIECAVKIAVENGDYPIEHYESYLRIMASL
jgi:ribosome biogenesis GTPase